MNVTVVESGRDTCPFQMQRTHLTKNTFSHGHVQNPLKTGGDAASDAARASLDFVASSQDRFDEAKKINSSLTAFGKVVLALTSSSKGTCVTPTHPFFFTQNQLYKHSHSVLFQLTRPHQPHPHPHIHVLLPSLPPHLFPSHIYTS